MSDADARCPVCGRGVLRPEHVTWRDPARDDGVIVHHVPARVCTFCGDQVFAGAVVELLERIADERPCPARTVAVPVYEFASARVEMSPA